MKYKIIIPKEEPYERTTQSISLSEVDKEESKQETLEEFIRKESKSGNESVGITKGAKWQAERMYSEEDLKEAFYDGWLLSSSGASFRNAIKKWFEQFKKK